MTSEERLHLRDKYSKTTQPFVPNNGNEVHWFNNGTNLHNTMDINHILYYLSTDIARRVMQHYFGYDVVYHINIDDTNDKIVERIPEENSIAKNMMINFTNTVKMLKDNEISLEHEKHIHLSETGKNQRTSTADSLPSDKHTPKKSFDNDVDILPLSSKAFISRKKHPSVNELFIELAHHYESEFNAYLVLLNILPPSFKTRTSDYICDIIKVVQKTILKGYAYESNGTVYFDMSKFNNEHPFVSMKLHRDDISVSKEREETLASENKNDNTSAYVLLKKSESHEHFWQSPWGPGRPGTEILYSFMGNIVLDTSCDIYTNTFPHYDNIIEQCTGDYVNRLYVNYDLGDLYLHEFATPTSTNNCFTVQQAFKTYNARQIRLFVLLMSTTSSFNADNMEKKKLILTTNEYMWTHTTTNCLLLKSIATYITHIIDIFGLNSTSIDHIGFTSANQ